LGFGGDGEFVMAVVGGTGVRKVLVIGFVLVNVIEIVWKEAVRCGRRTTVERSASNTLKGPKINI
jgi:hypothetical protein